jgi:predicted PurR-regulated permease PerM
VQIVATEEEEHGAASRQGATPAGWQSTIPKWIGVGLFIYASVAVLAQAKNFLVPIVMAFLLSMVFGPIRRVFDRRGIPSGVSALMIVATLLILFFGLLTALSVPVTQWVENAPRIERQIRVKVTDLSRSFHRLSQANETIQEATRSDPKVQQVEVKDEGVATSVAMLAPGVVTQFVFTFVLLLFLLASGDMFYEKLVHVMPTFKDKRRAVRIAYSIERKLSRYLMTITAINVCLGIAVGLAMWLLGMPNPLVFGVIAFVFNYIPYLGALAGIVVAGAVALVTFDGLVWTAVIPGVYFGLTAVEGQLVTPYFVGRRLQLNTVVVFISVSFWAWLWSAVGMIVAVPLLVAIKTFCEHVDGFNGFGHFLSERGAESDRPAETSGDDGQKNASL